MSIYGLEITIPEPPEDPSIGELISWLDEVHNEIQNKLNNYAYMELPVQHSVPDRVRDGLLVYADGTNWNPGLGEGVYAYYNSTWNKL